MVKKIVLWALVVSCMISIFCFSHQPGDESLYLSDGLLYKILVFFKVNTKSRTILYFSFLIRKIAHFSIYAVLGFLVYTLMNIGHEIKGRISIGCALLTCALYAVTDEIHQLFVPGRTGRFFDVALDSAGALFGIMIAFGIWYIVTRSRNHG